MGHRAAYMRWAAAVLATAALVAIATWAWSTYSLGGLKDVLTVTGSLIALLSPLFAWALRRRQHTARHENPSSRYARTCWPGT
ncbi:hypothetical protein [Streptomyces sclerotialus]|uniref:hypothetical protein n=1 Tax=Streptomyces sclerotialus TaxID=1957 RepID=UPI0004C5BBC5